MAAVEQCGRARLPAVTGVHPWREVADLVSPHALRLLLDPGSSGRPALLPEGAGSAVLLVGPEGGFTVGEGQELLALGCRGLGLGPRTLRVETAAVVGAALLLLGPRA